MLHTIEHTKGFSGTNTGDFYSPFTNTTTLTVYRSSKLFPRSEIGHLRCQRCQDSASRKLLVSVAKRKLHCATIMPRFGWEHNHNVVGDLVKTILGFRPEKQSPKKHNATELFP